MSEGAGLLMDQFATAYQQEYTQKQEPKQSKNFSKFMGSFGQLNSERSTQDGSVDLEQRSSSSNMSIFQR